MAAKTPVMISSGIELATGVECIAAIEKDERNRFDGKKERI